MALDYNKLDLAANLGAFSTYDSEVLMPEVAKLKPGQVYLEVGVDKGKSLSIARMVAKDGVFVVGVDLRPNPNVPDTLFYQEDSTQFKFGQAKVDVIFIDGDHTYEGCKADIDNWFPQMAEGGVMTFHDCDATSPGVVQAVREFAQENKFQLWESPMERCSMARIYLP